MIKIFISYRRADSRKDAGRIYDRLVQAFGKENIFKDVDDIKFGDFRGILREAVAKCDVELVIIGKQWLNIKDADGNRRLDNAGDFVRIEVESGLQRDKCLVVPVLVDNAPMPPADDLPSELRQLAFQNAYTVRDDPDFHGDVGKLIRDLKAHYNISGKKSPTERKVKAPSFNVRTAIADFYTAFENDELDRAREILSDIRASDNVPRLFDVDAYEQEVWDAKERAERDEQYDLLRMVAKYGTKQQAWEALQIFWNDFPGYDPDEIFHTTHSNISTEVLPEALSLRTFIERTLELFNLKPNHAKVDPAIGLEVKKRHQKELSQEEQLLEDAIRIRSIIGGPFEWCLIPTGVFLYGVDKKNLSLPDYAIAKYPITYQQYQIFIDSQNGFGDSRWWKDLPYTSEKPSEPKWKVDNHPRDNTGWYDAIAFCRWLSWNLGGEHAVDHIDTWFTRLPTEFEWEKAARGTDGRIYPYGNIFDRSRSNTKNSNIGRTTTVTQFPQGASPYGVFDMSGNIWEWCLSDHLDPKEKAHEEIINFGNDKKLCGGCWKDINHDTRVVSRIVSNPSLRRNIYGFRIMRPL